MNEMSFYDIGGYRDNVRRYKEGIEQLNDIQTMIKERVDIETNYSKSLHTYYDKWSDHVGRFTASSLRAVWKDILEESMELYKLHANVRDRMCDEILKTIALYLKENHHPSAFRASKETREIEEDFERAQRSWRRQFEKVEKAKKAFHIAARAERSAQVQMRNAYGDITVSSEVESKFRDRFQKCQAEMTKSEKAYRAALNDLNHLRKNYVSHMNDVFESCQQKELKRLKFAFEMLSNLQKVLVDISHATKLNHLHRNLESKFVSDSSRFNSDLENWSKKFGPDCETKWPEFEPFIPLLNNIISRKKKKDSEVVLVKQTFKDDDGCNSSGYLKEDSSALNISSDMSNAGKAGTIIKNTEFAVDCANGTLTSEEMKSSKTENHYEQPPPLSMHSFNEYSMEITSDTGVTSSNPDIYAAEFKPYTAKVIYDYDAQDCDELSLKKGEQIEVLTMPDHLNWISGMKNGQIGFFPAAFVRRI